MRKHECLPDLSLGKEGEGNVEPSPSRQREQMDHSLQCPRLRGIKWQRTSSCWVITRAGMWWDPRSMGPGPDTWTRVRWKAQQLSWIWPRPVHPPQGRRGLWSCVHKGCLVWKCLAADIWPRSSYWSCLILKIHCLIWEGDAPGAVISAVVQNKRQHSGNPSNCEPVRNYPPRQFPKEIPIWQENISEKYINFISSLNREASKCCVTALLKYFPSLQVHINNRSKTQGKEAALNPSLPVRLKQQILAAFISPFWHIARVSGFALSCYSAETLTLWKMQVLAVAGPNRQVWGKTNPGGKRNKAVLSDGHSRESRLAKPGSISLYTLYKTITRRWVQLLDSIKERILTEKVNIQSDLWHSLFLVYPTAGSSFFFISEGYVFTALRVGRQGVAGYVPVQRPQLQRFEILWGTSAPLLLAHLWETKFKWPDEGLEK